MHIFLYKQEATGRHQPRRQDSYQQAVDKGSYKKGADRNSYQQAVDSLDSSSHPENLPGKKFFRQESYQQAMGTLGQGNMPPPKPRRSPILEINSALEKESKILRQESYQQAMDSLVQGKPPEKPRRQESYQQAVDTQEDLPELKNPDLSKAADVIQSVFKGFTEELQAATDKIQSECEGKAGNIKFLKKCLTMK